MSRAAAVAYDLNYSTLYRGVQAGGFQGHGGRRSEALTLQEEQKIIDHILWKKSIGYGVNFEMLQLLLQEVLVAVMNANPLRLTGHEGAGQMPGKSWVRMFAKRHHIVLRKTSEILKGTQVVRPEEVEKWQGELLTFCTSRPELL